MNKISVYAAEGRDGMFYAIVNGPGVHHVGPGLATLEAAAEEARKMHSRIIAGLGARITHVVRREGFDYPQSS